MILKKILFLINTCFGILLFLSFFGIFISIFFFPRLTISSHNFNTPAVLLTVVFLCIFVVFLLKPFLKDMSGLKITYPSGPGYWLTILVLLAAVLMADYFSIYLGLTSKYLGELDFETQKTLLVTADAGKKIYFEFDSGSFDKAGTKVNITISGPDNWLYEKVYTIGKKSSTKSERRTATSGTTITSATNTLTANGKYMIRFEQLDNNVNIKQVRIFEK